MNSPCPISGRRWRIATVTTALAMAAMAAAAQTGAGQARFERFTYEGRAEEAVRTRPSEYRNPILSGYYPDPSVTRVGADYYLINSSFANFPGIPVFHSKNLVDWRQIGNAVSRPEQFDFTGLTSSRGIYAPDISYKDGLFYIVTTCVECGGNAVMTARDPAGPWSQPTRLGFGGIDPSIFWDSDGRAYIVNNDGPVGTPLYDGHRAIWMQEFDPKTLKMVGERTLLVNGGVDLAKRPIWIEGPHVLKRGRYYYLMAAEGGTGTQHSQVVLRATSVRGPYIPAVNNPILTQRDLPPGRPNPVSAAGHAKFVETQNGEWWSVFLATRPYAADFYNIGRETFLLPVTWKDEWPSILAPGVAIPYKAPRPKLPRQTPAALPLSGDFAYVDEFDGATLAEQWIGVRTPRAPFYTLDKGALVLTAAGKLGELGTAPAFIGRRQQHHIASISTILSYPAVQEGDRAGLVAYQSDASYLFFGVTRIDGRKVVALYKRTKATQELLVASAPLADGAVALTLRQSGAKLRFDYAIDGRTLRLADDVDATFLSTNQAGGFTGTVFGLYTGK
jgi:xylan 1,4-beta-xylosidase